MIDCNHYYNIYKGLNDEDNIIRGNKEEAEESKLTPANEKPKDRRVKGPQKANIYGRNKSRFSKVGEKEKAEKEEKEEILP